MPTAVKTLIAASATLAELAIAVALVGCAEPALARTFVQARSSPFPLLLDVDGEATAAYGLTQRSPHRTLTARVLTGWIHHGPGSRARGSGPGPRGARQPPGTFVVDPAGIVRYAHRYQGIEDEPGFGRLVEAAAEATVRDGGGGPRAMR